MSPRRAAKRRIAESARYAAAGHRDASRAGLAIAAGDAGRHRDRRAARLLAARPRGAEDRHCRASSMHVRRVPPLPASALARSAGDAAEQVYRRGATARPLGRRAHGLSRQPADERRAPASSSSRRCSSTASPTRCWCSAAGRRATSCDRTLLPALPTPAGNVEVDGLIAPPPARLYQFVGGAPAGRSGKISTSRVSPRETGLRLLPLSVLQTRFPFDRRRWPAAPVAAPGGRCRRSTTATPSSGSRSPRRWHPLCLVPTHPRQAAPRLKRSASRCTRCRRRVPTRSAGAPRKGRLRCCWCCWSAPRRWSRRT